MCAIIISAVVVSAIGGAIGTAIGGPESGLTTILAGIGLLLGGFWGWQVVAAASRREEW